jgi:AGZA family xanthine/uracil permease-like MFS transporter
MPLTYSIAYGLVGGIASYILLHSWDWACQATRRLGCRKEIGGGAERTNGGGEEQRRDMESA